MPPRKKQADKVQPETEAAPADEAGQESAAPEGYVAIEGSIRNWRVVDGENQYQEQNEDGEWSDWIDCIEPEGDVYSVIGITATDMGKFLEWLADADVPVSYGVVKNLTESVGKAIDSRIESIESEGDTLIGLDPKKSYRLVGDIRDFILDRLKNAQDKRSWDEQNAEQQRETVEQATEAARHLVREIIALIAGRSHEVIKATVKGVKSDGDKIEAGLIVGVEDEHRHELFDAAGHSVIIVVTDPAHYMGEGEPVPIKADQTDMLNEIKKAWDGEGDPPADQPGEGETGELDLGGDAEAEGNGDPEGGEDATAAGEDAEDVRPQFMKDNEASKNEEAE